jgi:hypothetical protein
MVGHHEQQSALYPPLRRVSESLNEKPIAGSFIDSVVGTKVVGDAPKVAAILPEIGSGVHALRGILVNGVVEVAGGVETGAVRARV